MRGPSGRGSATRKRSPSSARSAKPELPDWKTLEVGAYEPEVPEELVQQELDAVRATVAELVPVEGRPVGPEDTVIVDLVSQAVSRPNHWLSALVAALLMPLFLDLFPLEDFDSERRILDAYVIASCTYGDLFFNLLRRL